MLIQHASMLTTTNHNIPQHTPTYPQDIPTHPKIPQHTPNIPKHTLTYPNLPKPIHPSPTLSRPTQTKPNQTLSDLIHYPNQLYQPNHIQTYLIPYIRHLVVPFTSIFIVLPGISIFFTSSLQPLPTRDKIKLNISFSFIALIMEIQSDQN